MDVFAISPATPKPLWFLTIICVLLAVVVVALAYTAYSARNSRVELGVEGIRLVGDFWGRAIPLEQLDTGGARILNLGRDSEYAPKRRTLGTGLPGYASGWFRLRNGEKALVYLTNRQQVVYVPTVAGYSLLLSVEEPERLISKLQQYGGLTDK